MRCPGPPCSLGPYCWRNNVGKKHYKRKIHHLRSLIRHAEQGGRLHTYEDIPSEIRKQLYTKEQQDGERQRKYKATSQSSYPPINIVLPY
jgi:hypothetical protein